MRVSTHANRFALVELELSTFPCLVSDAFLKLENIKPNKIKVSEMGKYFDVLRIICHTEKKEEMESHQNR